MTPNQGIGIKSTHGQAPPRADLAALELSHGHGDEVRGHGHALLPRESPLPGTRCLGLGRLECAHEARRPRRDCHLRLVRDLISGGGGSLLALCTSFDHWPRIAFDTSRGAPWFRALWYGIKETLVHA